MADAARLPVTIVTGFLGSGKTTLVNHILAATHGLDIAVMVNELGDIAIDGALIEGAGDGVVELANGCVCCSINNDLADALARLLRREKKVDYLVVETTGVADPLPIALTFLRPEFGEKVRVDAIVALADAENFALDGITGQAARNQLRYADIVLVNKCDRVKEARLRAVEDAVRTGAPGARLARTTQARIALPLLLSVGLFEPDRRRPGAGSGHDHGHLALDGFEAVSFASAQPFGAEKFQSFLERLPPELFRAKGILEVEGAAGPLLFHLVGRRFTLDPAPPGAGPGNRLVLIGRNLDAARLRAELCECLAPSAAPAQSGFRITADNVASSPASPTAAHIAAPPSPV
ncbi:MAG TPA: GTP-binding protein [Stellaceae bacterium]